MKKLAHTLVFLVLAVAFGSTAIAQETFPVNGVHDQRDGWYAFTNATIYPSYDQKLEGATLLIKKGKVEAVGTSVDIPANAVVIDLKGKTIYPSFIDVYSNYGMPEVKRNTEGGGRRGGPQPLSKKEGAYSWNQAMKPEVRAHEHFKVDDKTAKTYREIGFGAVVTHQMDGISRGTSTFVALQQRTRT